MLSSLENLVWSDEYATGIDIIDDQHKRLFDYFAGIRQCIADGKTEGIEAICHGLVDYAVSHNSFEEVLMKQADYPMLDAHHAVHEAFKERAQGYLQRLATEEDSMQVARVIYMEIGLWLINHIKREDRHYVPYVKKSLEQGFVASVFKRFFN